MSSRIKYSEERATQSIEGYWYIRDLKVGDIVKVKPDLEKQQPVLFPEAGYCIVIRVVKHIYENYPDEHLLHVLSKKRGIFKIQPECCMLVIGVDFA